MTSGELAIASLATLVVIGLGYLVTCWIWPFTACRHCTGSGKRRSPTGRAWRDCRHCNGTGQRLRCGWRIANQASKNTKHL